jgi:hypothetical protein
LLTFAATHRFAWAQPAAGGVEAHLVERVMHNPADGSSWRLLGRVRMERGDAHGALEACRRAVQCDPASASSHFDLARVLWTLGHHEPAAFHFSESTRLAPDSEYARESGSYLRHVAPDAAAEVIAPASFEEAPNRFGGVPAEEVIAPEAVSPLSVRLDLGALYNTNVQLAPLSRTIFSGATESFQLFAAPQMELRAWETEAWSVGAALSGYFTLNEEEFSNFNVQSYRPGLFVERALVSDLADWVGRVQYDFQQDLFDARRFAVRHTLITSLDAGWAAGYSRMYWAIDYSDFASDGADPSLSSQDGWTNTIGASHEYDPGCGPWERLRGGVDVQMADLRGDNFAYNGVFLYGEGEISLLSDVWAVLQVGWGYRDYPEFQFHPSRNEHLWRYGAELHKQLNEVLRLTGFITYDRFDSQNAFYSADRYLVGGMMTYMH